MAVYGFEASMMTMNLKVQAADVRLTVIKLYENVANMAEMRYLVEKSKGLR